MDPSTTRFYSDPEANDAVVRLARARGLEVTYDTEGRPVLVTVDEGELYLTVCQHVENGRGSVVSERTVTAIETLSGFRWAELRRELDADLTALAGKVRDQLAGAVEALSSRVDGNGSAGRAVLDLAQAHRELISLARAEQAEKNAVDDEIQRRGYIRLLDAAGRLCDVVAEHRLEEFEGRLDDLPGPLNELAAAIGHSSARDYGQAIA